METHKNVTVREIKYFDASKQVNRLLNLNGFIREFFFSTVRSNELNLDSHKYTIFNEDNSILNLILSSSNNWIQDLFNGNPKGGMGEQEVLVNTKSSPNMGVLFSFLGVVC